MYLNYRLLPHLHLRYESGRHACINDFILLNTMQENSSLLTLILYEFPESRPQLRLFVFRLNLQCVSTVDQLRSSAVAAPSNSTSSPVAAVSGTTSTFSAYMSSDTVYVCTCAYFIFSGVFIFFARGGFSVEVDERVC